MGKGKYGVPVTFSRVFTKTRPTRYKSLGYRQDGPGLWRIIDISEGLDSEVGEHYKTKAELLADLSNFARNFGCEDAK